ncbi:MAG: PRC-barrel domain-containing protein [Nitrospirota bacterium]|nr:PRC-barrel domain-containing protein [Nitrospirota bacterium]
MMTKLWVAFAAVALCTTFTLNPSIAARDKSGVLKASNLIGAKVQDTEGKKLGDIKDLVIDPLEGDIEYVVLDFGGFLGIGDKYFAIPWEAMHLSDNQKYLVLDVSKKDLKHAPGFSKDQWPDMSNREWIVTVYEYYNLPRPEEGESATDKSTGTHKK